MNICLVEDNDALRDTLCQVLSKRGFHIVGVADAHALDDARSRVGFEVFLLDIQLPGEDGLSIAHRLKRVDPSCYVVMMTARGQIADRVLGYETGADIYLPKPVELDELTAVLKSLQMRLDQRRKAAGVTDFCLFTDRFAISYPPADRELALTATEWRLLKALIEAPGHKLAYWQLLELMGKQVDEMTKRTLEVHIAHLRGKIRELGGPKNPIQSIRGEGYHLSMAWTVGHSLG